MGSIQNISTVNNVNLLYTNSSKAEMFVYDTIKSCCNATKESIFEVSTKKEFNNMQELSNMQPFLADKWIFVINYTKLKSLCKLNKGIFQAETSCFLVKVINYKEYKEFKEILPTCNDIYLSYLRSYDISFILKGSELSQKMLNFIQLSYASDVEKVFDLKEKLENGAKVEKTKDIVQLVGISGGTISNLAIQLLNEPPTTSRGFNMVCRRRLQTINELCETYDISSVKNFLTAAVKDILDIKVLYMQGVIFKKIRDIPEQYDEKRLSKYQYCITTITEKIPYIRILRLYTLLKTSSKWYSKRDILMFLYNYYNLDSVDIKEA